MPTQNIPTANNNPGDIKDPSTGTFMKFSTPQEGYAALLNDLHTKQSGQSKTGLTPTSTLVDFAKVYAPSSDKNNPGQYAANLANQMGVAPNAQIKDLDLGKWAAAIAKNEGYQGANSIGTNPMQLPQAQASTGTPQPQSPSLGSQLISRTQDAGSAINTLGSGISELTQGQSLKGAEDTASGVLQTGGAVAGGIGDTLNAAIGLIPGVKQAEGLLGAGVNKVVSTPLGQQAVGAYQGFSAAHPELSKDIEAAGNIASLIPAVKGIGIAADAAKLGASGLLKGAGEEAVGKEIGEVAGRTVGGRNIIQQATAQGHDPVSVLSQKAFQPAIKDGVYDTADASTNLDEAISHIDENELQPMLDKGSTGAIANRIPLSQYKDVAVNAAKDQLMDTGPVEKLFNLIQQKYGDFPTLSQMNQAKRIVANKITEGGFASPDYSTNKLVRNALQQSVEDGASANGLGDVNAVNKKMASLIKAQQLLSKISGKKVKMGALGKVGQEILTNGATAGGEAIGNTTGLPFAGALIGRAAGAGAGKLIGKKSVGGLLGSFSRISK